MDTSEVPMDTSEVPMDTSEENTARTESQTPRRPNKRAAPEGGGLTELSESSKERASKRPASAKSTCFHYIGYPAAWTELERKRSVVVDDKKKEPARTWKFSLDGFQQKSIQCLEKGENVFVAAHTSAGKTVVAEYAIAMALREHARVIYTTPIKALSNQKYREFKEEFEDVGLMTGDITISQDAAIIVMTTEILRNMLYRGSETLKEARFVVFDEVHYMRDLTRGVVWEEAIILLPEKIGLVFLSATLSNANQFADWIAQLKSVPCHVVSTEYRPTPLIHYAFPMCGGGLHLIKDEKGIFKSRNFQNAQKEMKTSQKSARYVGVSQDLGKVIKQVASTAWLPAIIFCFSRRECEGVALYLSAKNKYTSKDEQDSIAEVYENAMLGLSEEDRQLEQVTKMLPLLSSGIGVHHSGLLPIVKEIVELLFQENLIKILIATETFAMGINMPARTVVFASLTKFDGVSNRVLKSGEYIQMSGRAGRRGIDDQGFCIFLLDDSVSEEECQQLLTGKPMPLISTFRLTYNMLLNLLRVETINAENIVLKSFHAFQQRVESKESEKALSELEASRKEVDEKHDVDAVLYVDLCTKKEELEKKMTQFALTTCDLLPFLQPGRLIHVGSMDTPNYWGWGVLINFQRRYVQSNIFIMDVLLEIGSVEKVADFWIPYPPQIPPTRNTKVAVVRIKSSLITKISAIRVYLPQSLEPEVQRNRVFSVMFEALRQYDNNPPLLHPIQDFKGNKNVLGPYVAEYNALSKKIASDPIHKMTPVERKVKVDKAKKAVILLDKMARLRRKVRMSTIEEFERELKKRMKVLLELGHIDSEGILLRKGRMAAEIESVDGLVLSELLLSGSTNDLSPPHLVAFLTCLYPMENKNSAIKNPPSDKVLAKAYLELQKVARRIGELQKKCGMEIEVDEYVGSFSPEISEVALAWCQGKSFRELAKMTKMFEGSIIRCLRRLQELLDRLKSAAIVIGDRALSSKFEEGRQALVRGIVFAGSLYT